MTSKERLVASLTHQQPDRTPYELGFTEKAYAATVEFCGNSDFMQLLHNDMHHVRRNPGPKDMWLSDTVWQDEFGVQWDRSIDRDIGNVCNQAIPARDMDAVELPDPYAPEAFAGFAEQVAAGKANDMFIQFHVGFSLFERAWTMRGLEQFYLDMVEEPVFAGELLDAICDHNVALVNQAVKHDIDAVHFGDDWGSQRGLLMGPRIWEQLIKPRLARQYAAAKEGGAFVTTHSCGKVQELFPQLIEIGLDCFNPFQPEVMDPFEMKAQFGDRLSFWGGISTQKLLPYGTVDEVRTQVRRLINEVGKDGGYIAAPAHAIPGDGKPENILAMIETLNDQ